MNYNVKNFSQFNIDSQVQQEFLNMFPGNTRGWIANKFCEAVRKGCNTPESIIEAVSSQVSHIIETAWYDTSKENLFLKGISENSGLALRYAQYVIEWESLPNDVKNKIKDYRDAIYKQKYLEEQAPTPKQVWYLGKLGYKGEIKSKWHANVLIQQLKGGVFYGQQ